MDKQKARGRLTMSQLNTDAFHTFFKNVLSPALKKEGATIEQLKLNEKTELYTSKKGQNQCSNGESFLASVAPGKSNTLKFSVSKKYIFGNGHNKDFLVIDRGNDVTFEAVPQTQTTV